MDTLKISKESLIEQLAAKRAVAVKFDSDQLKAHRVNCKERAAVRRLWLRSVINLPDAKLAEMSGRIDWQMPEGSSCPMSKTDQFDKALDWVKHDARKLFTVHANETYGLLLAWTPTPSNATVCKDT